MSVCRICSKPTIDVFSLGALYPSDFIPMEAVPDKKKIELALSFCPSCSLLQLRDIFEVSDLYGKYWYRSGTNKSMKDALGDVVDKGLKYSGIKPGDLWLDIASNDGTLLSYVPEGITTVGVDPAEDSYKEAALQVCDDVVQDFFSVAAFKRSKYGNRKAKVVSVIAMFYDLNDPCGFLRDVYEVMEDDGLLILQMSYTPLMINQLAFDNICHEHVCYYSLTSINKAFEKTGFKIVHCELNDVNGGSFRVYAKKRKTPASSFVTTPFRYMADMNLDMMYTYEESGEFNTFSRYKYFYMELQTLKKNTVSFIHQEVDQGAVVWGYGASTKGNTLLQYYGLDSGVIDNIAERSPYKYGLKTIGTNIPICSEANMRKAHPDYLLVLPWHFVDEFVTREETYLKMGGCMILPCPKFELITA
jgi:NDP-4-keto-2,6-dideoxyhexose 3-C-methyltransferase